MTPDPERRMLASVDMPRLPDEAFANSLLDRLLEQIFDDTYSSTDLVYRHRLEEPTMIANLPSLVVPLRGMHAGAFPEPNRSQPWRFGRKFPVLLASASAISIWNGNDPEPVRIIPAAVVDVDDMPANNAAVETLFAATVSPDQIPLDLLLNWNKSSINYLELEPGGSYNTDHPAFSCCRGITVQTVITGEVSFEIQGPVLVYRSGEGVSDPEVVASGTLATTGAGDTFVREMSDPGFIINNGDETTTFLGGYVYNLPSPEPEGANTYPDGYGLAELIWAQTFTPSVSTEGPVNVSFDQITFGPGEDLVIDRSDSQVLLSAMIDGRLEMKFLEPDGAIKEGRSSLLLFGPRASALDIFSSEQYVLANESEEPAVLYLFRFDPPESGSG